MDNEVEGHDGYHLLVVVVGGLLQFKVNRKWIALLERITERIQNFGYFLVKINIDISYS